MVFLANTPLGLEFDPMAFVENLQYMGIGMLVIFVIIGVIALCTALINKIFSKKSIDTHELERICKILDFDFFFLSLCVLRIAAASAYRSGQ